MRSTLQRLVMPQRLLVLLALSLLLSLLPACPPAAAQNADEALTPGAVVDEDGETAMSFRAPPQGDAPATAATQAVTGTTPAQPDATGDTADTGADVGMETVAPAPTPDTWPKQIVVTVGGDCTLGSTDSQRERVEGFDYVVRDMGFAWPFSELLPYFGQDDLTLVNFEGTLTESEDKAEKLFNFKGPADYAMMLTLGSVEAVTLANNHFGDYGDQGRTDTMAALDAEGITYCRSGHTAIYETRGVKIGLIGNTFSYKNGECDISADVRALREAGCQIVIASFHWGSEYETDYTRDQRNIGRAAVRSGADVVVGHHPHIIQGIEQYEGTYILYSLGNLVFGGNYDPDKDKRDTYIAQLTFTVHEDGTVEGPQLKIIPYRLTAQESGTDYRPVPAQGEEYDSIMSMIIRRSPNMDDFINPQ